MANFGNGAIAVVGHTGDHQGDAMRSVALVNDFFHGSALFGIAGATPDGPFDIVFGHILGAGAINSELQAYIGAGVTAALANGNDDLPGQAGEDLASFGVLRAFLAPDGCPMRMSRHGYFS